MLKLLLFLTTMAFAQDLPPTDGAQIHKAIGVNNSTGSATFYQDFFNDGSGSCRLRDDQGNLLTSHLVSSSQSLDTDVRHSVLPDGAATEATLSSFKSEAHTDSAALLAELTAFAAANHVDLTQIDSDLTAFKSEAHTDSTALLAALNAFALVNHTDLLGVQSRQDTTNINIGATNESAASSDTTISGLNGLIKRLNQHATTSEGKLDTVNSNLVTVQGKQDTTNTEIGATNETAAATDTSTSGLNGLFKRLLQRITTLIAFYASDFGVTSNAIRVAAIPGDSSGNVTPAGDTVGRARFEKITNGTNTATVTSDGSLQAVGNVAAAATDSGNPIKIGGVYNSTQPTLTDGQRGNMQLSSKGAALVAGSAAVGSAPIDNPVSVSGIDDNGLKRHLRTDARGGLNLAAASTATHTLVTPTANVSTQLAAANTNRKWILFINNSGGAFFLKLGTAAVINQGIEVSTNGGTFFMNQTMLYTGAINGIVGSNARTIEVIEGT